MGILLKQIHENLLKMPVTNVSSLGGLNKLKAMHNLRQKEVLCPVTKFTVQTTPLTVGDDLSLRTMVSSPDLYDREIAALIYKHTKFPDFETRPTFDNFIDIFSSFDRRIILYGIYSSTYEIISEKEELKCPNCKYEFTDTIKTEEIISPDSYTIWDKEVPFTEYKKTINVPIEPEKENTINSLDFITAVPSIRDYFNILKLVSPEKMKNNFDKTGQILSKSEELSLITQAIKVNSNVQGTNEIDTISDTPNINQAINMYITSDVVNSVVEQYNDEFDKYSPTFKKSYICSNCGHEFDQFINIESSLFRTFFAF